MAKPEPTIAEAFNDKKLRIMRTTPTGVAVYPHIVHYDKYQFEEGNGKQCNTQLILDDAEDFIEDLRVKADEAFEIGKAQLQEEIDGGKLKGKALAKAKANLKDLEVFYPFEDDVDDEGDPNGKVILKKAKTMVAGTDDDGNVWEKEVPIFDAAGNKIEGQARAKLKLWAGSQIKLSVQLVPFCAPGLGIAGISLRLAACQVISLAGSSATADTFGFGAEEGGYTADDSDAGFSDETGGSESSEEEDPDF
jgi:hypothetical protein